MGASQNMGYSLGGFAIMKIRVFFGPYWVPPILGN